MHLFVAGFLKKKSPRIIKSPVPINPQIFFGCLRFWPSQVLLKSQLPSQADARASSAEEVDLVGSGKERSNGEGSLETTIFRRKQWYSIKTLKKLYLKIMLNNGFFRQIMVYKAFMKSKEDRILGWMFQLWLTPSKMNE